MELDLTGRVAVVTGASKGIGLAITTLLVKEGVHVFAGARGSSEELTALGESGQVEHVGVDLGTQEGAAVLVDAATSRGPLDILVNNVGAVTPRLAGFLAVTDEQWTHSLNLNLMAAVRTTLAALPTMLAQERGVIVTTSSVNAFLPDPTVIDYGAAKAALSNFCKSLSKEVGPYGVRVNTVSPGPVATELWLGDHGVAATIARDKGGDASAVAESAAADSVTGRFTLPSEVADLVVYLASDRAANITGADFTIDGGLTTTL
jgi:NAD(P)-dependent dehydrogenase (short-subunit alcohol dehydrogenase family)